MTSFDLTRLVLSTRFALMYIWPKIYAYGRKAKLGSAYLFVGGGSNEILSFLKSITNILLYLKPAYAASENTWLTPHSTLKLIITFAAARNAIF